MLRFYLEAKSLSCFRGADLSNSLYPTTVKSGQATVVISMVSQTLKMSLVNAHSTTNKTLILNDFISHNI